MKGIRTWALQDFTHVLHTKSHQASVPSRRFWSFFDFSRKENASQDSTELPSSKTIVPSGLANTIENASGIRAPEADSMTTAVTLTTNPLSSTFFFEPKEASKTTSKAQGFFFERDALLSLLDGNPVPRNLKLKLKGYKTLRHENAGDFAFVPGGASCDYDIVPRGNYDGWTRTTTSISDAGNRASATRTIAKSFEATPLAILPSQKPKTSNDVSSSNSSSIIAESHQQNSKYSPSPAVDDNIQKITAHPDHLTWKPVENQKGSQRTTETLSWKPETQPETQFNRYSQASSQPVKYESKSGPSPTTSCQETRPHFRSGQEIKFEKVPDQIESSKYSSSNILDDKPATTPKTCDSSSHQGIERPSVREFAKLEDRSQENPLYSTTKCSSSKGLSKPSPPSPGDCTSKCGSTILAEEKQNSGEAHREISEKHNSPSENSSMEPARHVANEWSSMERTTPEIGSPNQREMLSKVTLSEPSVSHSFENNKTATVEDPSTTYFAPLPPRKWTDRSINSPKAVLVNQRKSREEAMRSQPETLKKLEDDKASTAGNSSRTYFAPLPPSRSTRRSIDSPRSSSSNQGGRANRVVRSERETSCKTEQDRARTREEPSTAYFAPLPQRRSTHPSIARPRSISQDNIPRSRASPRGDHSALLQAQNQRNPSSRAAGSSRLARNEDQRGIPSSIDSSSCSGSSGNNGSKKPPGSLPPSVPRRASSSKCPGAIGESPRKISSGQNSPRRAPWARNSASSIFTGASIGRKCRGGEDAGEGKVICTKPREDKCGRSSERSCKREATCDRRNKCQQRGARDKCQRGEAGGSKCKKERRRDKCREDGGRKAKRSKPCKRYCCPELTNTIDCAFEREQCPKKSKKRCKPEEGERRDRGCSRGRDRSCSRGRDRSCGRDTSTRKRDPTCLPDPKQEASCGRRQERECEGKGQKFCTDPSRSRRDCGTERRESAGRNRCRENARGRDKNDSCEKEERECSGDDRASSRRFCTEPRRESCRRERSCERQCRNSANGSGRRSYSQLIGSTRRSSLCDNSVSFSSLRSPTCSALGKRIQSSVLELQSRKRNEGESKGYSTCEKDRFPAKKDSKPGPSCKSSKDSCSKMPKCKPPEEKVTKKKCTKGPAKCLPKRPSACEKISKDSKCDKASPEKKTCGSTSDKCKKASGDVCAKRKEICMKDKGERPEESMKDKVDKEYKEMQECKKNLKSAHKDKKIDGAGKQKKSETTGLERVISPCKKDQQQKKQDDSGKKCGSKRSSQKFSDILYLVSSFKRNQPNVNDAFSSKHQETSIRDLDNFQRATSAPLNVTMNKKDGTKLALNEPAVKVNYTKAAGSAGLADRILELWNGEETSSMEALPLLVHSEDDGREDSDENLTSRNAWTPSWFG
ncbi:hypothetical protein KM043_009782 [Ampulex compressa]|nr:hypothetical protein KM043_009782 [Ampulex compressa]